MFSRQIHQTTIFTALDRYPEIFAECALILQRSRLRILSFGCSTGEEPATLRHYFPNAEIFGTDINAHNLKICRGMAPELGLTFFRSSPGMIRKHGPYDVVFCMAVLQRTPHLLMELDIRNIEKIYPFAKFENQLIMLDQSLVSGSLLVIEHTNYRLADTVLSQRYAPLPFRPPETSSVLKFDRASERLEAEPQPVIFVKL